MSISIPYSISVEQPHFETDQIVLWHIRTVPVPGVVIAANDETEQATIKLRNLAGQTQSVTVAYSEIEVRS
jgi:hypothetical protein